MPFPRLFLIWLNMTIGFLPNSGLTLLSCLIIFICCMLQQHVDPPFGSKPSSDFSFIFFSATCPAAPPAAAPISPAILQFILQISWVRKHSSLSYSLIAIDIECQKKESKMIQNAMILFQALGFFLHVQSSLRILQGKHHPELSHGAWKCVFSHAGRLQIVPSPTIFCHILSFSM